MKNDFPLDLSLDYDKVKKSLELVNQTKWTKDLIVGIILKKNEPKQKLERLNQVKYIKNML